MNAAYAAIIKTDEIESLRKVPQMNDDFNGFQIEVSDDEVRTLLYAVNEALRVWPGAPARPVEEQEQLQVLRIPSLGCLLKRIGS